MYFLNYFLSFHLEIATSTIATHITDDIDGEGGSGLRKLSIPLFGMKRLWILLKILRKSLKQKEMEK